MQQDGQLVVAVVQRRPRRAELPREDLTCHGRAERARGLRRPVDVSPRPRPSNRVSRAAGTCYKCAHPAVGLDQLAKLELAEEHEGRKRPRLALELLRPPVHTELEQPTIVHFQHAVGLRALAHRGVEVKGLAGAEAARALVLEGDRGSRATVALVSLGSGSRSTR